MERRAPPIICEIGPLDHPRLDSLGAAARSVVRRPLTTAFALAVVVLALQIALVLRQPAVPVIQDEFAELLQADAYARGRLTNPTHPLSEHFESLHVIHQPTYQGKFPPAQGLVMAFGIEEPSSSTG